MRSSHTDILSRGEVHQSLDIWIHAQYLGYIVYKMGIGACRVGRVNSHGHTQYCVESGCRVGHWSFFSSSSLLLVDQVSLRFGRIRIRNRRTPRHRSEHPPLPVQL
jgi:hypothetical protein